MRSYLSCLIQEVSYILRNWWISYIRVFSLNPKWNIWRAAKFMCVHVGNTVSFFEGKEIKKHLMRWNLKMNVRFAPSADLGNIQSSSYIPIQGRHRSIFSPVKKRSCFLCLILKSKLKILVWDRCIIYKNVSSLYWYNHRSQYDGWRIPWINVSGT